MLIHLAILFQHPPRHFNNVLPTVIHKLFALELLVVLIQTVLIAASTICGTIIACCKA